MKTQNLVFEVSCPDLDKDYWYKVTTTNKYEAVEEFANSKDTERDGPWFPNQHNGVKLQVKDPEGVVHDMEVHAEFAINYHIYDAGE